MTERTTVRLRPELLDRAKRKAAAEGRTLTSLIEEALLRVVAESTEAAKREPVMPRISKAEGGLMPGIDLGDMGAPSPPTDGARQPQSRERRWAFPRCLAQFHARFRSADAPLTPPSPPARGGRGKVYEPDRLVTGLTGWMGDRFEGSAGGTCRCRGERPVRWMNGRSLSPGFWRARMG
jgi:hypothetical protein